jgi:alpha-1,3-rhamnosyl/mannosyltransferase
MIDDVAVNLLWLRPGAVGGSEEYLTRQLVGLAEHGVSTRVFAPKGFAAVHPEVAATHEVVEGPHDSSSRGRRIATESTWLYRRTRDASLVHHGGGTLPTRRRQPTVLTIHDLQYRRFPEYFSTLRRSYLHAMMPRSARGATLIAVPTLYVRETVVDAYGVDPSRVVVVPHGVDESLNRHCTPEDELRARFDLGEGPIVVYPAVTHPHKGHRFIVDVADRHWSHLGVRLVLMGGAGAAHAEVTARLADPRVARTVVHVGRVSDADRNGLVRMAQALAFPSEYEGFGAPVIEAMQLGTPVVVSDHAALPEVVGDAGIVLALQEDLWAGLPDLVRARRTELVQRGVEHVRRYSIDASGAALAAAYRMVVP